MIADHHHELITDLIGTSLTLGDQIQFKVVSNSMAILINSGDSVLMEITQPNSIKRGDIVVVRRDGDFLTHRAICPANSGWITKGDNTIQFDSPAKTGNIIGRVVTIHKVDQSTLQTGKWYRFNLILANLSELEARTFSFQPLLCSPFRFCIKIVQNYMLWRNR